MLVDPKRLNPFCVGLLVLFGASRAFASDPAAPASVISPPASATLELRIAAHRDRDQRLVHRAEAAEVLDGGEVVARWVPIRPASVSAVTADSRLVARTTDTGDTELLVLIDPITRPIEQTDIHRVYTTTDQRGKPAVGLVFGDRGGRLLGALTRANLQRHLAIIVDGQVHTAPTIQSTLGNHAVMSGHYTAAEAAAMVTALTPATPAAAGPMSSAPTYAHTVGRTMTVLLFGALALVVAGIVVVIFLFGRKAG